MSREKDPERQAIGNHYLSRSARRVLILAFSVLLAILVGGAWNALATLGEIHAREQAARLDFLSRAEPLMQIHAKLTLYGDLVQKSASDRASFTEARRLFLQIQSELARYPAARKPEEQSLILQLQLMLPDHDRVQSLAGMESLPSQLRVVAATEQITFWNTHQFRSADSELLTNFHQRRERLKRLLFILLGSGLVIAVAASS